jgi:hypothetical protein
MNRNYILGAVAAVIIAFCIGYYGLGSKTSMLAGSASACTDGYTCFSNLETQGNSIVDGTSSFIGTITGAIATFSGLITADGGLRHSYTNATSTTATSETIIQADILNYETVLMTPNGAGGLTVTFPATSTVTSFVPTAGDMQQQCWYNATSTASTPITFAAGTGFDFEVASSTSKAVQGNANSNLSIGTGNSGCFTFIRKANTDIVAEFQSFTDGD